ncbi:MAG: dehydrogenase [Planctomycetota bacterium]|nr:MAG: dehydrogenase [Planctomycetota bacterium]
MQTAAERREIRTVIAGGRGVADGDSMPSFRESCEMVYCGRRLCKRSVSAGIRSVHRMTAVVLAASLAWFGAVAGAADIVIPHHQDKPPGPRLSPQEAIARMKVPPGFHVELVAGEPDIVNPVAMAIDERGRFWITESLEYPRSSSGPGRDRIKVLEDTDGDGKADKVSVFAEGLNIPSGIAVGYGGVWVANAPDILFLQDTDGDGKADRKEVVVTGFGRHDTHELPNSFTWGPDGWLYGLNGVFNFSHVKYAPENPNYDPKHPGWKFTCCMFRIHPRTREFQVFAEGTSNPWGIAFNDAGDAFVSACVIDHLWHITETGYYHRQAGAYPPFTWKIGSIVDHRHQKAAYCGIHFFDSDAYPEPYRRRLFMGNIHGNCINVDRLSRNGATYRGDGEPDFLIANDAWFMPVVQKTGPDGCLYILDWYDRYHCYQDARRDPKGIDRLNGRLYRIRYKDTPRVWGFDLARADDAELIAKLGAANDYTRRTAQRLLQQRDSAAAGERLLKLVRNPDAPQVQRRHAAFALSGMPSTVQRFIAQPVLDDPAIEAWRVRTWGELYARSEGSPAVPCGYEPLFDRQTETAGHSTAGGHISSTHAATRAVLQRYPAPQSVPAPVRLQLVIAWAKTPAAPAVVARRLAAVLAVSADDPLIPRIVWQNLLPLFERNATDVVRAFRTGEAIDAARRSGLLQRLVDRVTTLPGVDALLALVGVVTRPPVHDDAATAVLQAVAGRLQTGEVSGERRKRLAERLRPMLKEFARAFVQHPAPSPQRRRFEGTALAVAVTLGDPDAAKWARDAIAAPRTLPDEKLELLRALVHAGDPAAPALAERLLGGADARDARFQASVIGELGRADSIEAADVLIRAYPKLHPQNQPLAVEVLTQRPQWAKRLLLGIGQRIVPPQALNLNQARRLMQFGDSELKELLARHWGTIREGRDPRRQEVIERMKKLLATTPGDPHRGAAVFKKVCGQCHKIYGEGAEVGPDLTSNGRNSYEQLLSNVFDPNLVIGAGYQAWTVATTSGRVLTGLLVERSDQRIVLKVQGGKREVVPADQIEVLKKSDVSMMPEDLEKQLKPQEIADLFAFLTLDRPPTDPQARRLPGAPQPPRPKKGNGE